MGFVQEDEIPIIWQTRKLIIIVSENVKIEKKIPSFCYVMKPVLSNTSRDSVIMQNRLNGSQLKERKYLRAIYLSNPLSDFI